MYLTLNMIVVVAIFISYTKVDAQHCCLSKKFFGKGFIVKATLKPGSSTPSMSQDSFEVDSDYDRKLHAVNGTKITETVSGEVLELYQVIRDFNHMKKYYFNDTHCDVEHIVDEQMPDGCVPKTLTLIGTYTMGSGSQSMQINGWSGKVLNETWTYATTVNDCTTVSYTILGTQPDGTKISETAQFADIVQQRNSYDGVFDVPDHCKHFAYNNANCCLGGKCGWKVMLS